MHFDAHVANPAVETPGRPENLARAAVRKHLDAAWDLLAELFLLWNELELVQGVVVLRCPRYFLVVLHIVMFVVVKARGPDPRDHAGFCPGAKDELTECVPKD